ncbi:MAG: hypothetical protein WBA44_01950 [Mesorhizobium sp.]
MTIANTPFLRNVLLIDGAAGLAMGGAVAGMAPLLAPFLDLPQALLFWAGLALVPVGLFLLALSRRQTVSRLVLIDIVALNSLWAAASFGLMLTGTITPNALGVAFVAGQALFVGALAACQLQSLRTAASAA